MLKPFSTIHTRVAEPIEKPKNASNFLCASTCVAAEKFSIDPAKSSLEWTDSKVTDTHSGTLAIKEGYVELKDGLPIDGQVIFDMMSINNNDLQDPKYKQKLENHLKSDGFFSVESFETASFQINKAGTTPNKDNLYIIEGSLTRKDLSKPLSFESQISETDTSYNAKASLSFFI